MADDLGSEPVTVSLGGSAASVITFGPAMRASVDADLIDFWASIEAAGLNARTVVRTIEGGTGPLVLSQFVQELADDWLGQVPSRHFESIEHDLSITATRDLFGHVRLRVTLRDSYRSESWEASAEVKVDAGEEMAAFAAGIRRLLGVA